MVPVINTPSISIATLHPTSNYPRRSSIIIQILACSTFKMAFRRPFKPAGSSDSSGLSDISEVSEPFEPVAASWTPINRLRAEPAPSPAPAATPTPAPTNPAPGPAPAPAPTPTNPAPAPGPSSGNLVTPDTSLDTTGTTQSFHTVRTSSPGEPTGPKPLPDDSLVCLQTNDGTQYHIERKTAKVSGNLARVLEALPRLDENEPMPLKSIDGETLGWVIEWMEYHRDEKDPSKPGASLPINPSDWDKAFFSNKNTKEMERLLYAAGTLQIRGLLTIAAHAICNRLSQARTPQEFSELYTDKSYSFEPDDSVQVRYENDWEMDVPESEDWKETGQLTEDSLDQTITTDHDINIHQY